MPLYEVPVYVKVAAPAAVAAWRHLYDTTALDSLRQKGLHDCVRDPENDHDGICMYRSPNENEEGVGGYAVGQPKRLREWRESRGVLMEEQIKEV
jgi:hypothetical protein